METDKAFETTLCDYYTYLTHQDGTRYYMINYFFFLKIEKIDFEKNFHIGPLKSFMKLEHLTNEKFLLDEKAEKKIKEQLQICQNLINDDYMIIPFCSSLITKFPYIEQMQFCLDKFVKMYFNPNISENDIFHYIKYLTKGIIIPSPDKSLNFYIPYHEKALSITSTTLDDYPIVISSLWKILKFFSIENIVFIFQLIIMEQKILFVAEKLNYLSEIIDGFVNLIYPLQYI